MKLLGGLEERSSRGLRAVSCVSVDKDTLALYVIKLCVHNAKKLPDMFRVMLSSSYFNF